MNVLFMIDWYLLDKTETFCHTIQRWVGLTCFLLAKVAMFGAMAMYPFAYGDDLIQFIVFSLLAKYLFRFTAFFMKMAGLTYYPLSFREIDELEDAVAGDLSGGLKNRFAHINAVTSIIRVMWIIVSLFFWLFFDRWNMDLRRSLGVTAKDLLCFSVMYLVICTPLPPQKSKLRKGLDKLVESFSSSPDQMPEPTPA